MSRGEDAKQWCRLRVEQSRHQEMVRCYAVRTLRVSRALTYEPCSVRVLHPYRMHPRFRRLRRDHGLRLGHHPDERIHRLPELHLVHHLDEQNQHQQDVVQNHLDDLLHLRHLDEVRRTLPDEDHRRHQGGLHHLPDVGHLGDPFPAMEKTDYYLGEQPGAEYPCPGLLRKGCCLDEEFQGWLGSGLPELPLEPPEQLQLESALPDLLPEQLLV